MNNFFSIAIPCYGYDGDGSKFLDFNLNKINQQSFKDFEVVISDHSLDDTILNIVNKWKPVLDIKYIKNEDGRGIISPNLNKALINCSGEWIKILFQDDFFYDDKSLEITHKFILENDVEAWLATKFLHTQNGVDFFREFLPIYHETIWDGKNTMGCPSILTIKNENLSLFNESLHWLVDVEYYKRMHDIHGLPNILNDVTVANRVDNKGVSSKINDELKNSEKKQLEEIYGK